jgi:hypothetical protein
LLDGIAALKHDGFQPRDGLVTYNLAQKVSTSRSYRRPNADRDVKSKDDEDANTKDAEASPA